MRVSSCTGACAHVRCSFLIYQQILSVAGSSQLGSTTFKSNLQMVFKGMLCRQWKRLALKH